MGGAPVPRPDKLEARPRRGVHRELARLALRRGAGQARLGSGLRCLDVVERQQGGDGLHIGERAQRIEACHAKSLREPPPRNQGRRRRGIGGGTRRPFAEVEPRRRDHLHGFEPLKKCGKVARREAGSFEQAGRYVEPSGAEAAWVAREREQQVGPARFQQGVFRQGAGGDKPDHVTPDRRLGIARASSAGFFHLLGDRNAEAAPDEAREVAFGGVNRHPAHRNGGSAVLPPRGERDVECGGGGFGVGEEHLVEVAHAEKEQGLRVLFFELEPARHCGRGGVARTGRLRLRVHRRQV